MANTQWEDVVRQEIELFSRQALSLNIDVNEIRRTFLFRAPFFTGVWDKLGGKGTYDILVEILSRINPRGNGEQSQAGQL